VKYSLDETDKPLYFTLEGEIDASLRFASRQFSLGILLFSAGLEAT